MYNSFLQKHLPKTNIGRNRFLKKTYTNQNNSEKKRLIVLHNPVSMLEE